MSTGQIEYVNRQLDHFYLLCEKDESMPTKKPSALPESGGLLDPTPGIGTREASTSH